MSIFRYDTCICKRVKVLFTVGSENDDGYLCSGPDSISRKTDRHPMRGDGKGKPSSIPNQSMNILNIENDDLDGFERNEDGEILIAGKDNSEKPTPFTGKIKSMGLEELRALFLKVQREGDSALDGLGDLYGTRRAYDFDDYELKLDKYNLGESKKIEAAQKSIDDAKDPTQAYKAFMKFAETRMPGC